MVARVDNAKWIAGKTVVGGNGIGVKASQLPSDGGSGGSYLRYSMTYPDDNDKVIRGLVITRPSVGTLVGPDEYGVFTYTGPDTNFTYQLYVDGVAVGPVSTVFLTSQLIPGYTMSNMPVASYFGMLSRLFN